MSFRKFCLLTGAVLCFAAVPLHAQEAAESEQAPPAAEEKTETRSRRSVRGLPTCIDFSEVYARVIAEEAAQEEVYEMTTLAALTMGYVSALQDMYGGRLVGASAKATEWTFLGSVYKYCLSNPQVNFQRAVRNVPSILKTMEALKTQEFERCQNYIEQTKESICYNACKEKK